MSDHIAEPILLVGAGKIAIEYAKVLTDLNKSYICVGRSEFSASTFTKTTGVRAEAGGIDTFIKGRKGRDSLPSNAIVAVNVEQLYPVTLSLLESGVKKILLEKPGGVDGQEIKKITEKARQKNAIVYVAYNRRFYASTIRAKEIIEADGGITSFHFDFTELSHLIASSTINAKVKENWLLANSTHVTDTAFYLGGEPDTLVCHTSGTLDWHPSASIFSGAGKTMKGVPFSYHANWSSPGRWGIWLMTKNHRLILQPMEELYIQKAASFQYEKEELDNKNDLDYKPGFYNMIDAFLKDSDPRLLPIEDQQRRVKSYYDLIKNGRSR